MRLLLLSTLLLPVVVLPDVDCVLEGFSTLPDLVADASGRNTLTVLLRIWVVLPELLFELSRRCTVTFLPVVRS